MHALALVTVLAGLVAAQSSSSSRAASSASSAPLNTATASASGPPQRISVGPPSGGLLFQPNVIIAPPGSKLEFHFYPRNHSVVSGPYNTPCQASPNSIYSGFYPSSNGEAGQTFTVTINDTNPIWLYCSYPGHCQGGMAAVVNPPPANSGQTLTGYIAAAKNAQGAQTPPKIAGGVVGGNGGAGAGAASTPGATPGKTTPSATTMPGKGSSTGSAGAAKTSGAAVTVEKGIAGVFGAAGAVAGLLL